MPDISVFANVGVPDNPTLVDLYEYLEHTRDGMFKDVVLDVRKIKDKKERDEAKKTMLTATLSGHFSYRNNDKLVKHSGLICIDWDNGDDIERRREMLMKDKYIFSVFLSTSGNGLRILFHIEEHKHDEAFEGIAKYLFEEYGIVADRNGRALSKPFVVSYDPLLYIAGSIESVPVFKKYVKETVIKAVEFFHSPEDFRDVMKQIVGRSVWICPSYSDWIKVGFAISKEFGENGRKDFHDLSRCSPKYSFKETDKQYDNILKAKGVTQANIASFYYLAKANNIKITSEQTKSVIKTTVNGLRAGLKRDQIIANLKKFQGIENVDGIVNFAIENDAGEENKNESTYHQLEMFISSNYDIWMNEINGYLEEGKKKRLTPNDLNTLFVAAKKRIPTLDYRDMMRLLKSDFVPSYNPFYEFLGSDGIPYILPPIPEKDNNANFKSPIIDTLAETIENEEPQYTRMFVRKWIVSIISAAHGVHTPLFLALLGRTQGTGKTEWFRRLFPDDWKQYYAESKLDKEKDDELAMTENLLIVDDELAGKTKRDMDVMKSITSKDHYYIRRPYGDHNEKIARLAALGGTSNKLKILNDPTGNRRIITIEVIDINKVLYNSINKKDLFLEAYQLYKNGFDWRVAGDDITFLNKNHEEYEVTSNERELLHLWFKPGLAIKEVEEIWLSSTEILIELQNHSNIRLNSTTLGNELENSGFIRKSCREKGNKFPKKWCVIRRPPTDRNEGESF